MSKRRQLNEVREGWAPSQNEKVDIENHEKSFWTYRQGLTMIRTETVTVSVRTKMRSLLKVGIKAYIHYHFTESSTR
jgi:hypothetical protein